LSGAVQYVDPGTAIKTATVTLGSGTIDTTSGPTTIVAVKSGTGQFAAGTTVSAVASATRFTVSSVPTTALNGAVICDGTCALFNSPSVAGSTTQFTVNSTNDTLQWGGGFTCLKGVDKNKIKVVTDLSTVGSSWTEVVK
jgi:hypothetical protein